MEIHIRDAQGDHMELITKWLEETMLKVTQTQHIMQSFTNNNGIMENKLEALTSELNNLQVATTKNGGHIRELQVTMTYSRFYIDTIWD